MRFIVSALVAFVSLTAAFGAHADKYSVRDVGLTDLEIAPYRIIMVAKDPKAPDVKTKQAALLKDIAPAKIKLDVFAVDDKALATELENVKLKEKFTEPQYWLRRENRFKAVNPAKIQEVLKSSFRDEIYKEIMTSLCVVVLIESTDKKANEAAKATIDAALSHFNEVRNETPKEFWKAPDHDVKVLELKVEARKDERWTLWALGEKEEAPATPKVAVLYGKMRRAGALFEGPKWTDEDLFARIALLGQEWGGDARPIAATLPYLWTNWPGKHDFGFDPIKKEADIKAILDEAPVKEPRKRLRKYEDFQRPQRQRQAAPIVPDEEPAPPEPPAVSSTPVGIVFLIAGILGWIALGVWVWKLEQKMQEQQAKSP